MERVDETMTKNNNYILDACWTGDMNMVAHIASVIKSLVQQKFPLGQ